MVNMVTKLINQLEKSEFLGKEQRICDRDGLVKEYRIICLGRRSIEDKKSKTKASGQEREAEEERGQLSNFLLVLCPEW